MNRLKNTRCYLAGAIEKDTDGGMSWRKKVREDLSGYGIHFLDPTDKPIGGFEETPELHAKLRTYREESWIAGVQNIMNPICKIDLRLVDISDFIIANVNPAVPTFGTHEELSRAASQNKPILVRIEGGLRNAPLWWFERLNPNLFFDSFSDIDYYLSVVDKSPMSNAELLRTTGFQWMFFDWMGK